MDPTYFCRHPLGYQRLNNRDSIHPHNIVLHPQSASTDSWISEDLLTMHHIDEPVQGGEHLTLITEDMSLSTERFDYPELARAPQHSVSTFPTMNFHKSVYFDELMDQPMRTSESNDAGTQNLSEPVHTAPAMTQFAPLPLALDIFDINPEREITLDDQIEQPEIPFDDFY